MLYRSAVDLSYDPLRIPTQPPLWAVFDVNFQDMLCVISHLERLYDYERDRHRARKEGKRMRQLPYTVNELQDYLCGSQSQSQIPSGDTTKSG